MLDLILDIILAHGIPESIGLFGKGQCFTRIALAFAAGHAVISLSEIVECIIKIKPLIRNGLVIHAEAFFLLLSSQVSALLSRIARNNFFAD
jgi:hypothetical protein